MIKIRAHFSGWTIATPEQARRFVQYMMNGTNVNRAKMIKIIEAQHLRGVTVAELLEGADK